MSAKLVVFGSGRGSNFISIYNQIRSGQLKASVSAVFSDNPNARILESAKAFGFSTELVSSLTMLALLEKYQPDYIVLAGYLKKIPRNVVEKFENKIINIHPSLLPSFGGKGMYGHHVHNAVYQSGVKITGATVHFVNEAYDDGYILMQDSVNLSGHESIEDIATKVLAIEHELFPRALNCLINKKYTIQDKRVRLL